MLLRLTLLFSSSSSSSSSVVSLDRFWLTTGLVLELEFGGVMSCPEASVGQSSTSCFPQLQGETLCDSHAYLILRSISISTLALLFLPSCFSCHIWLARARMSSR